MGSGAAYLVLRDMPARARAYLLFVGPALKQMWGQESALIALREHLAEFLIGAIRLLARLAPICCLGT